MLLHHLLLLLPADVLLGLLVQSHGQRSLLLVLLHTQVLQVLLLLLILSQQHLVLESRTQKHKITQGSDDSDRGLLLLLLSST